MDDETYIDPKVNSMISEICDDLEDLREALIGALQSYEKDLKLAIGRIPVWTEIQEDDVYDLFEIPEIEGAILGPRSVAIIAQSIDDHVDTWLGYPGNILAKKFNDSDTKAYRRDCAEVESELLELSHSARRVTSEATKKLGEDLDAIMHRLDEEREHDENALKDLVVDGSVEKGDSARLEIADLWERYRSHAESLNTVWEELESLAFQGMDMVVAGIEDIRWIMRQSDDTLTLINPELSPAYEVFDIPVRDEARATFEIPREESEDKKISTGDRETIEIDREQAQTLEKAKENQSKKDETVSAKDTDEAPPEIAPTTDISEVSEVVGDEFWASRKTYVPAPIPFFELAIWALPLLTLIALGVTFGVNPQAIESLKIPNLEIIAGVVALFLILIPVIRKWNFTPFPSRKIEDSEDIKIEIGEHVKIDNNKINPDNFKLERWSDDESTDFGWQLTISDVVLVGMETNLTRWQSFSSEIVDRDDEAWRLGKSPFRTLCKALSISLT